MFHRNLSVVCLTVAALGIWWPLTGNTTHTMSDEENGLQIHFLDVGQGDAILIETPDNVQVLIDGGPNNAVLRELAAHMDYFDTSLDMVIATHPDTDHIGGLIDVFERYEVAHVLHTNNQSDTATAAHFIEARDSEGAVLTEARAGQVWQLGASTTLEVLWPTGDGSGLESNRSSIVVLVRYGSTEFLLTGDAPASVEEYLVAQYGTDLESEVLKLGHHGSDTSSSVLFLGTVQPEYVVVSAGKDNRYGHPDPDVLKRVEATNAVLLSTVDSGTVTLYADGGKVHQR